MDFVLPNLHYEKFADGMVKCIEDEIPFELPDGWAWSRLGSISSAIQYGLSNSAEQTGVQRLLRITDIQDGKVNWDTVPFTTVQDPEQYLLKKGDIVFARTGATVGKSFLIEETPYPAVYASYLIRIRLLDGVYPEYIYQFFNSQCYWNQITDKSVGVGQPNCNGTSLKELFIPFPPANEQSRIVPASRSALEYVVEIESQKNLLLEDISTIKSKILDLAIRGKLVPQNPDDEPASVLLERIRAEKEELIQQGKIKRDKKESIIFKGEDNSYYEKFDSGEIKCIDEDVPFELPDSWCWCRLGTLFAHNTGKALNSSDTAGTLMTYITTSNLYWDHFELDSLKEMPFTASEIEKCTVTKGDLLVCEGGDIGRSAIWMFDYDIRIQNHIHRLRPYISLSNRFYYYVLYMWKQLGLIGGQGIGLQGFSSKALHNLIVPFPPIKVQETIVAFVDEINQKLSSIENSLS